ncbi:MAG: hypothetical protein H0T47_11460 [Planctomycetaceae bacterium]|nr:hypothetical protein [Planctomycetaceae bacterium]
MTHEVACGRCGGRLRVNVRSGEVLCPHCGAGLAVPDDPAALDAAATLETLDERVTDGGTSSVFDSAALRSGDVSIPVPSSIKAPDFTRWGKSDSSAIKTDELKTNPNASPAGSLFHAGEHADPLSALGGKLKELPVQSAAPVTPGRPKDRPVEAAPAPTQLASKPAAGGISRGTFLAVTIYASAITAVCLGLAYFLLTNRQHQLESLPDVVPPMNDDGTLTRVLVPPGAKLPSGHVLSLGESRRFGDLRVTPIKVTREPLEFVHFQSEEQREAAGDVLKLWLKLENVGEKSFAPLDENLLFYRTFDTAGGSRLKANNFVTTADRSTDDLIPIFDHPIGSDWDLAGQNLGATLEPGASIDTYVPTETDVSDPSGPLVWRIHLRKGIAPNGWGVTTLVEVATSG